MHIAKRRIDLRCFLQPSAHDYARGYLETEVLVEAHHVGVCFSNQELHFHYPSLAEPVLCRLHHAPAHALVARCRTGSNVVEPASMPVMADHDAARYFAGIVNGDKHVRAGTSFGETEVGYPVIV